MTNEIGPDIRVFLFEDDYDYIFVAESYDPEQIGWILYACMVEHDMTFDPAEAVIVVDKISFREFADENGEMESTFEIDSNGELHTLVIVPRDKVFIEES